MNKSLKALSLLVAITSTIPAIAGDPNELQPGTVVGTIGGSITQITEQPVTKNESRLQRLYNFVSNNKANIALGAISVLVISLGLYHLYDLLYITGPADRKMMADIKELQRQIKIAIAIFKGLSE